MKISIVGGGNAGCITALHYAFYTQDIDNLEIELIYNPDIPPEPVAQGTLLDVPKLLITFEELFIPENSSCGKLSFLRTDVVSRI